MYLRRIDYAVSHPPPRETISFLCLPLATLLSIPVSPLLCSFLVRACVRVCVSFLLFYFLLLSLVDRSLLIGKLTSSQESENVEFNFRT